MWMPNFAHVNNASTAAASTNAVTATAMRTDLGDRLYRAGPNSARKDTQTVIVKKMEIVVLTATIWPNLENGRMIVWVRGIAAITVVTALLTIEIPIWLTADLVRQCRIDVKLCKRKQQQCKSTINDVAADCRPLRQDQASHYQVSTSRCYMAYFGLGQ